MLFFIQAEAESVQRRIEDNKLGESKSVSSYDRAIIVFEELVKEQAIKRRILDKGNIRAEDIELIKQEKRDYRVSGLKVSGV